MLIKNKSLLIKLSNNNIMKSMLYFWEKRANRLIDFINNIN